MSRSRTPSIKHVVAAALAFAACAAALYAVLRPKPRIGELGYWYDLSEQQLFVAEARPVPPLRGIGGVPDDAYPAVVIRGKSGSDRRVAYLTSCTDELRDLRLQALQAEARGEPPPDRLGDRLWVTENTLVRSLTDEHWRPKNSPEGLAIIAVLTEPDAAGEYPRVCGPED
ncbi:MAG: hypothetical protein ACK4WH_02360 [Phycisphaerales bacterium]